MKSMLFHVFAQLDTTPLPGSGGNNASAGRIIEFANIAISIFAGIAVLVIVIAGLRYIIAKGEPQALAQAKNMIIYALVGLSVCIMAFSIVNFAISSV